MPLAYEITDSSYLRQGEILTGLLELQPRLPDKDGTSLHDIKTVNPNQHAYTIVISQDCDLKYDFDARNGEAKEHKLLKHILFCDLYTEQEIHDRNEIKSDILRRIKGNQEERYHCFCEAPITGTEQKIPALYADYKITFSLPTEWVYWLINNKLAQRLGIVTTPYMQEFIHRQYNFLSRIATPPQQEDKVD